MSNTGYIYLLKPFEYIKTEKNIYKIGRTRQKNLDRTNQYPGCQVILLIECSDHINSETDLIRLFKKKYKLYHGREYFEGDYQDMINTISNYLYEKRIELGKLNILNEDYYLDETGYLFDEKKPDYNAIINYHYFPKKLEDKNHIVSYIYIESIYKHENFDSYLYEKIEKDIKQSYILEYNNRDYFKRCEIKPKEYELIENIFKNEVMQQKLIEIDLAGIKINYIGSINLLINIRNIQMNNNEIEKINFIYNSPINSLKNLIELNLSDNLLSNIDELKPAINIEHLYLSNNKLNEISEVITTFKKLKILRMDSNLIKNIPENIKNLTLLEYLDLGGNEIEIIPENIKYLKNLNYLGLRCNNISTIPYYIKYLNKLEEFSFSNNKLKDTFLLKELKNIKRLYITQDNIVGYPKKLIKNKIIYDKLAYDLAQLKYKKLKDTKNINIKLYLYLDKNFLGSFFSNDNGIDSLILLTLKPSKNYICLEKNNGKIIINGKKKYTLDNYHIYEILNILLMQNHDFKEHTIDLNKQYNYELQKIRKKYLFELNGNQFTKKAFCNMLNIEQLNMNRKEYQNIHNTKFPDKINKRIITLKKKIK